MPPSTDHYDRLQIARDATPAQIRRAYHRAVRRQHPDLNDEPGATEGFLALQQAYEVLSDPNLRSAYDAGLPPLEENLAGIKYELMYSRSSLPRITEPQLVYAYLELAAPDDSKARPSPPLNVCLVLDRSTSMRGERMDTVKSTAIELLRQLGPRDIFSIVTFNDRAEVLVSAGIPQERSPSESKIQMIQPSGGTEILYGLEAGFFEVRSRLSSDYINHMILLTDGRTYGDEQACLQVAGQAAGLGIGISGLGIGAEFNDLFVDRLAAITGGSSMYISQPSDIRYFLKQRVSGLGQVYAEQVVLELELQKGIELRYAFRISPDANQLETDSVIPLGVITKEHSLAVVLEFLLPVIDQDVTRYMLAEGWLKFVTPALEKKNYSLPINLIRPVADSGGIQSPPTRLLQAISHLTLYRLQERAQKKLADGQVEGASRLLQNLATHLFSRGKPELARSVLQEVDNLHRDRDLSQAGKKQIKYATRALLLPANLTERPSSAPRQDGLA